MRSGPGHKCVAPVLSQLVHALQAQATDAGDQGGGMPMTLTTVGTLMPPLRSILMKSKVASARRTQIQAAWARLARSGHAQEMGEPTAGGMGGLVCDSDT